MADEKVWRFEFVDRRIKDKDVESGIKDTISSGVSGKKDKNLVDKFEFGERFEDKIEGDIIKSVVLTPLNSSIGRVSRPLYMAGRRIVQGGSIGSALGGAAGAIAMMGIEAMINALEKRINDIQEQVRDLNNTDNALIRAGSVSTATYYTGNIFGVKQRTDRS